MAAVLFCSFLFLLTGKCIARKLSNDPRIEEFSRIKHYELLHVDTSEFAASNIIAFRAFDHVYRVQLELNEHMNPSHLRHTNGNPSETDDTLEQFYTHKTESCHYHGTVLNTNTTSSAAISMCDKRGIRGRISAFGETIIMKPSRYYLDLQHDSTKHHEFTDEHLVFKLSDMDTTDLKHDERGVVPDILPDADLEEFIPSNKRRLAAPNDGYNFVELAVMIGPYRLKTYKNIYGSKWYDEMIADHSGNRQYTR